MTDGIDMQAMNQRVIAKFRASRGIGEVGPVHFDSLVLLTTTGRRSGEQRTVPLGYTTDADGNLLLFASNMGASKDPDWYRNLEADPHVTVEITGATWSAEAVILFGAEREDAYRRWIDMAPHVADHQDTAGREIPLVRIARPAP
ncbi:MAG TPA: nitroreductase family deazaflavin-dependent oxidoreductase [Jatrophihabitans sp.]|jgi:deazaflavin-dependent oxidoreductase (nitroreductase family)|nr:nitroreductase family deazaflavin-dependent oxidoreductase [Jatrophihabitans sp.]